MLEWNSNKIYMSMWKLPNLINLVDILVIS
jgi:hypothetical protein